MKCQVVVLECSDVPGVYLHDLCSLRYWFYCTDVDSDGVISYQEMRVFYNVQLQVSAPIQTHIQTHDTT